ncbi:MAG: hypothetical protein HQK89_11665 [Nitrospirae bacterium]|nr:hypothetical protein [Nitrospirota bacterium]
MAKAIELYNILKGKLGEEGRRAIVEAIGEVSKDAKVGYKDDLKAIRQEMATKSDLQVLAMEFRISCLILLFVMILTTIRRL